MEYIAFNIVKEKYILRNFFYKLKKILKYLGLNMLFILPLISIYLVNVTKLYCFTQVSNPELLFINI